MTLHLTQDEIREATGRKRPGAQIRALREMGFIVQRRADGKPVVLRAHYEAMMGAITGRQAVREPEPDFEALRD